MKVNDAISELTIGDVVTYWADKSLRPNPEYQRGLTWSTEQQRLLIDSVFRGYPLPRFYFHHKTATGLLGSTSESYDIIDGQQRIAAMHAFQNDHWALFDPTDDRVPLPESIRTTPVAWASRTFSALTPDLQARFLATPLSVVVIEEFDSPDEVRDLFIRLQAGTALTRQQVRDAWPGNVGPYVESLAGKLDRQPRFQVFGFIDRRGDRATDSDVVDQYLVDRQVCSQLLTLFLARVGGGGIPSVTTRELDALYHANTGFDPAGPSAQRFEAVLRLCDRVVSQAPARVKVRKNRVYSLALLFQDLLSVEGAVLDDATITSIASAFYSDEGADEEPTGRTVSATTIARHYRWFLNTRLASVVFRGLDAQRIFSPEQKSAIWERSAGTCHVCEQPIEQGTEEYDHLTPWILGGKTVVENGRPVHQECHERGPSVRQRLRQQAGTDT